MKTEAEVREYLAQCERNALKALASNKWERFGYWGGQSVHLRAILGLSRTPSPFHEVAETARRLVKV